MPGYWMHETSGVLRPAVEAYLNAAPMTPQMIAAMRAYLRQWMEEGPWAGDEALAALKAHVKLIHDRDSLECWFDEAMDLGIDPL